MTIKLITITALMAIAASCSSVPEKWTTTVSGLQYKIVKKGSGPKPNITSRVKVHYEGQLTNGKVFDSSYKRGQPASFALNGVIKGWTEGLQLMSPGAVYIFKIPPKLAYGSAGAGKLIPPDSTLIFEVELISFH